jgi:hypothetical protein
MEKIFTSLYYSFLYINEWYRNISFFNDFKNKILLKELFQVLINFWKNLLLLTAGHRKNSIKIYLEFRTTIFIINKYYLLIISY